MGTCISGLCGKDAIRGRAAGKVGRVESSSESIRMGDKREAAECWR